MVLITSGVNDDSRGRLNSTDATNLGDKKLRRNIAINRRQYGFLQIAIC